MTNRLLDAVENAYAALDGADAVRNQDDDLAISASHGKLEAALRRFLVAVEDANETAEAAARIPAQVAAEDGVRRIGIPYQRGSVAA
jgi:hypothetical protein